MTALDVVFSSQCRGTVHGLAALSCGSRKRTTSSELRSCQLWSNYGGSFKTRGVSFRPEESGILRRQHNVPLGMRTASKSMVVIKAADGVGETDVSDEKAAKKASKKKTETGGKDIRTKITDFLETKSGYSWMLGPAVLTAAIVVPSTSISLVSLFQKSFFSGLVAVFALDILFVFASDLFLVLADKLGHHQQVSGGPPPWIGPWEYTGHPEGHPTVLNYIAYGSVGVGIVGIFLSLFTGKLLPAVAVFGPYLGLIFAQVAYERLLGNDRVPVFPLVPILYTVYRFRQLSRALGLLPVIAEGSGILTRCIHISSSLWALYLALYLTQLPWLYSTWNSNRAT